MFINAKKENRDLCSDNSMKVELGIQKGKDLDNSKAPQPLDSLEHLVLRSGSMALQNMVYVFRRQVNEDDLYLFSDDRRVRAENAYRQYEKNIRTLLTPHWNGPVRGLKKHVHRSLKPFRRSTGLLNRLLATPARITATACLMVLLAGRPADSAPLVNPTTDIRQFITPPVVKQDVSYKVVIFADSSLHDLGILLEQAPPQAQVVSLDPSGDLIGQMLDYLLENGPAESLHLFTHGAPGQLNFGKKVINQDTLRHQARQLSLLGTLLCGSRDIHLYGCQVAAGKEGYDFIHQLSLLTRADIAASDDFTGAAAKGGDWQLELVTGNVETHALASLDYTLLLAVGNPGHIIAGDGSGGGGGGESGNYSYISGSYIYHCYPGGSGGSGGGNNDSLIGTSGDDVVFGDGSGGGGGGGDPVCGYEGQGGRGGGGRDIINGGGGNDILFGDGFDGNDGVYSGGVGGFGGGGGGGGSYNSYYFAYYDGGRGGIGGGGGGGADYAHGGGGRYGGGGGGAGGYSTGGLGGGFNATDGASSSNDEGGGGGGGGYANGTGGFGGVFDGITPGNGGNGGNGTYTTGGGNGGNGGSDYGGGGGGGGFGGGVGGTGADWGSGGASGSRGGTSPVTLIDDSSQTVYFYVRGEVETPSAVAMTDRPGGAGHDILDGGPGSDYLFGMGGKNTFVFESNDAISGPDIDTIYDWNNGSGNKIRLQTGGISLDLETQIPAILAAQTSTPTVDDRTIIHQGGGGNPVTIVVKGLGRDLTTDDFTTGVAYEPFAWGMFLPAIVTPK